MDAQAIKYLKEYIVGQSEFSDFTARETYASFKFKNLTYVLYFNENDPGFLQLMLPKIDGQNPSEEDNKKALELSTKYKVGKFITIDNFLWISAEIFYVSSQGVEIVFRRLLFLLLQMYQDYKSYKQEVR